MSHDDVASSSSAFERFLKAMGPKIKRLLAASNIPAEDAEDVLQQALLALIYQWGSIRDPESWLLVTLRRHCGMYWRAYRRRLYLAVDAALLDCLSEPVAPAQERDDLLQDLRQMIGRLPPRCRSLLALRFQLGYEPAEVARRLGYRGSSIGQVTHRCLAALSRQMLAGASPGGAFAMDTEAVAAAPAHAIHAAAPAGPATVAVGPAVAVAGSAVAAAGPAVAATGSYAGAAESAAAAAGSAAAAISPATAGAGGAALAPGSPASSLPPVTSFSSVPRVPPNSPVSRVSPPLEVRLRRR